MAESEFSKEKSVVLVAGGSGSRMGTTLPKQFLILQDMPVLMWTINCFVQYDPTLQIVVVLPASQVNYWKGLCAEYRYTQPHTVVTGGETRFQSVKNGLDTIRNGGLIAVHDGVRPLVSVDTIDRCFQKATEAGAAIPVLPINETLRMGSMESSVTVDRNAYFSVQTPQVFQSAILKDSYHQPWSPEFTDDASVVEKKGYPVKLVLGNRENIKITHPEDLALAELLIKNGTMI